MGHNQYLKTTLLDFFQQQKSDKNILLSKSLVTFLVNPQNIVKIPCLMKVMSNYHSYK